MDSSEIAEKLRAAQRAIYADQYETAHAHVSNILEQDPNHIDALYMKAVCYRYDGRQEKALQTITTLKGVAPDFGRAYQEEGHLYKELDQPKEALNAFSLACQTNPALTASWKALSELQKGAGNNLAAEQALAQAARLDALPKELFAVTNFIFEDKLLKAEKLCRAFLRKNPTHVEGMRLLADIAVRFGVLEEADFLLESALTFEPANIQVRLDYIQVLRKRQKFDEALEQARYLLEEDPNNPVFLSHFAIENLQAGNFDTALDTFEKVLEILPNDPATLTSKGHALKTVGKQDSAVKAYQNAYRTTPDHGEAYHALANLKTYRFTDAELQAMQHQVQGKNLTTMSRIQLHFSLGKAFEDRKAFDEAFEHYEKGNALKKLQCRYSAEQMEAELKRQAETCTSELFQKHTSKGFPAPDPIFIVGLPRAGSTLLEQILASHSQVDGTMELPNILSLTHKLRRLPPPFDQFDYPENLHHLSAEQLHAFGQSYIEDTRTYRGTAPFFIDKMPNNFRHIGLIQLILPNAKIIDARRDAMSCCFSGFKQLFAEGQEFTYGLEEIGRYYRDYVSLMDHWNKVLPGKILRVSYEDVVADLEPQVRRILEFCDLPFEQACLDFHKTKRSVRTASSEQVRQPINKKGLEPWRPFENHLQILQDTLGPLA